MLRLLRVRNFALIDHLELDFDGGFNLLSGETGAGKSLIVDALGLLTGAKASTEMVRSGESRAVVEAAFDLARTASLPALSLKDKLEELGLDADTGDSDELIIRREISTDGRNRVFINSQPSTVAALRQLAEALIDIHGQHEQQTLFDPSRQLDLIDTFAGAVHESDEVRRLHSGIVATESELASLEADRARKMERMDLLRFQFDEIQKANPQPGEADQAREKLGVLLNAGKLLESATRGYELLYEAEDSAAAAISQAHRALRDAAQHDRRLQPIIEQMDTARILVQDIAYGLRDYAAGAESDPRAAEQLQTRLAELERLQRKYGPDLISYKDRVREEMDSIGLAENQKEELDRKITDLRAQYDRVARKLSAQRRSVSAKLEKDVERELQSLAMPHARFEIQWTDVPGGAHGFDRAGLLVSANPGEAPRPIEKTASGGELSRIMLAIRTVFSAERTPGTLVFDEIDSGIGGQAAEMVGKKLQGLSRRYQVLCVTHLAQIAAFADHQYSIQKHVMDGRTVTRVEPLSGEARVDELARMMSGSRVTESARKHIKELLGAGKR